MRLSLEIIGFCFTLLGGYLIGFSRGLKYAIQQIDKHFKK